MVDSSLVELVYKVAWKAAKRYSRRLHDQEDAAQYAILEAFRLLSSGKIPEEKRLKYASVRAHYSVIDYVRSVLFPGGHTKNIDSRPVVHQLRGEVVDEKWRRDLKAIEAELDFQSLLKKMERLSCSKRLPVTNDPIDRIMAASNGSLRMAHRFTGISRTTLRSRRSAMPA